MLMTRIRNLDGPLGKSLSMVDGKLVKTAAADLVNGIAHRIHVDDIEHLAKVVCGLGSNEALTWGVTDFDHCRITTQERFKAGRAPHGAIPRDNDHFRWPTGQGGLMLDIDQPHDGSEPFTSKRFDDLMADLLLWWRNASRFYRPSVSAFVSGPDGQELSGRGSMRCYAILDKAKNALPVGICIADALWKAGYGRIEFDKAERRQVRCPIDTAVWQPSRLDFAGKAVLAPRLTQKKFPPYVINGGVIDTEAAIAAGPGKFASVAAWASHSLEVRKALHSKRPEEKRRQRAYIARRVEGDVEAGLERKAAERKWRMSLLENTLTGDFKLHFRDRGVVTVADVLKNPRAFDLARLADPNDPTYAGDDRIAQLYANNGGEPRIFSHAHGGVKYVLKATA